MTGGNGIQSHKHSALEFLRLVEAGQIDQAYQQYVDMSGKHHNAFFPAGFPTLKAAMIENHRQFPHMHLEVKHVLGDGDLVAVHSHVVLNPGEQGLAVLHLFRFQGAKIVEMWDCGQAVPDDSPNADGIF